MRSLVIFLFALSALFPAMGANNPQEEPQKYEIEYSYGDGGHFYRLQRNFPMILKTGEVGNVLGCINLVISSEDRYSVLYIQVYGTNETVADFSDGLGKNIDNASRKELEMTLKGSANNNLKKTLSGNSTIYDARKPAFRGTKLGGFEAGIALFGLKLYNISGSRVFNNQDWERYVFSELMRQDIESITIGDLTFDMGDDVCTSEIFKQINKDLKTKAPWLYNKEMAMASSSSSSKASKKTTPRPITKVPGANTASANEPYSFQHIGESEKIGHDYNMNSWVSLNQSGRTIKTKIDRSVDEYGLGSVALYLLADNPDLAKIHAKAKKYKQENDGEWIRDDITIILSNNSEIKTKSFISSLVDVSSLADELCFVFQNKSSMQTYDIIQIEYDGIVIPLLGFRSAATLKAMTDDAQRRHSSKREFKPEYTGQD